ncbi:MAG: NUDIX domain-containing protein [bacterium]|nr:NUDIX domain-containing protein [bacterium]
MPPPVVRVVAVLIVQEDTVLLVRHTNSKHIEGIYGLPGGRLEEGETEAEGAKRELEEETGLVADLSDLTELPTLWKAEVTFKDGTKRNCSMRVFLCKKYTGELCGTEHEITEWVPLADVKNLMLLSNVESAIREALRLKTAR